jgi:biogenesis AIM24-like protein
MSYQPWPGRALLGGGLYNMELKGTGWVALVSGGPPMLLQVDDKPAYADPSCAITWSSGVRTDVKADVNLKTLIGRGSGEMFQIAFSGSGWVLIQPSEGPVAGMASASGGGSSQGNQGGVLGGTCPKVDRTVRYRVTRAQEPDRGSPCGSSHST